MVERVSLLSRFVDNSIATRHLVKFQDCTGDLGVKRRRERVLGRKLGLPLLNELLLNSHAVFR